MIQKDRTGVNYANTVTTNELGWVFREQPIVDYGIDAIIEVADEKVPLGQLIATQVKCGKSYFERHTKNGYDFPFDEAHKKYWLNYAAPVIVVLYNKESGLCIWEEISEKTVICTGKGYKISIPETQYFDKNARKKLESTFKNKNEFNERYARLENALPLMKGIIEGKRAFIEIEDEINRVIGAGNLRLIVEDGNSNVENEVVWMYFGNFETSLSKLFPWAEIDIDYDFYYGYDLEDYREAECPYDPETGEYLKGEISFEKWRSLKPSFRSYTVEAGEVAKYRFELSLNEIGEAFIVIHGYLTQTEL